MGSGKVFLIKWVGSTALSSLQLVVWCIIGDLSPGESLEIDSFLPFPLSLLVSLSIIPMVDFHRPVLDWIWCKEWPSLRREMIMKFLVDDMGLADSEKYHTNVYPVVAWTYKKGSTFMEKFNDDENVAMREIIYRPLILNGNLLHFCYTHYSAWLPSTNSFL